MHGEMLSMERPTLITVHLSDALSYMLKAHCMILRPNMFLHSRFWLHSEFATGPEFKHASHHRMGLIGIHGSHMALASCNTHIARITLHDFRVKSPLCIA
ncbi:hypothetical protein V6Z88_001406 [Aspergillus fumigatus]